MKLYKDGITRNTENPNVISELKKAGYQEVVEEPAPEVGSEQPEKPEKAKKEKAGE